MKLTKKGIETDYTRCTEGDLDGGSTRTHLVYRLPTPPQILRCLILHTYIV